MTDDSICKPFKGHPPFIDEFCVGLIGCVVNIGWAAAIGTVAIPSIKNLFRCSYGFRNVFQEDKYFLAAKAQSKSCGYTCYYCRWPPHLHLRPLGTLPWSSLPGSFLGPVEWFCPSESVSQPTSHAFQGSLRNVWSLSHLPKAYRADVGKILSWSPVLNFFIRNIQLPLAHLSTEKCLKIGI